MRRGAAIALLLALLAFASTASAAQRYAAPGGGGPKAECPQANPCSLKDAVEGADDNDEVIVTGGTYGLGAGIVSPEGSNVDIHGDFGAPMPRVTASVPGAVLAIYTPGSRIRYLEVVNEAAANPAGIVCHIDASVERVVSRASGKNATALRPQNNCAVRDSLLLASGQGAVALRATAFFPGYTAVARNVTALAAGPESTGAVSSYENAFVEPGSYKLDLRNSIAAGEGADIKAATGPLGPGNIVVASSNFDKAVATGTGTIFDVGGNQTAPPLFVDAAAGDYREAAGSPTIDAGVADQIGALDLDGNPRTLGIAPDIGAFERAPTVASVLSTQPQPGELTSLSVSPKKFHPAKAAPIRSCFQKYRDSIPGPRCGRFEFELTGAGVVTFGIERRLPGRRAGGRCRKPRPANESQPRCARFRALPGALGMEGVAGTNKVSFSGWLAGRKLKAGPYRVLGEAGGVVKSAAFRITG